MTEPEPPGPLAEVVMVSALLDSLIGGLHAYGVLTREQCVDLIDEAIAKLERAGVSHPAGEEVAAGARSRLTDLLRSYASSRPIPDR